MENKGLLDSFLWSALFGSIAFLLKLLKDLLNKPKVTKKDIYKGLVDLATVILFAGLWGWIFEYIAPSLANNNPQIVAISSAALGFTGLYLSQTWVYNIFKAVTHIDLKTLQTGEQEDEKS